MADLPEIEGYVDLEPIARGGFGVVYKAFQQRFGRVVALKVIEVTDLDDAARANFERECLAMGSLSWHPNVVDLHDSGITPDGRPYLVMAYLEAGSLADRLRRDGPMAWPSVMRAGVEVASALGAAHDAGTLHRDVKPENLLIGPFGEAELADFGIAAIEGPTRTGSGGAISLTMAHVAPEVLQGLPPDERSDVYSLGSTLHTLIAGTPPFDVSGRLGDVVSRIVLEPAPRLTGVPQPLADLILQLLAKEPAERSQSAAAAGRRLQAIQQAMGQPVTALRLKQGADEAPVLPPPTAPRPVAPAAPAPPAPPAPPPRSGAGRRAVLIGAGVVAVLAVIVGGVLVGTRGSSGPSTSTTGKPEVNLPAAQVTATVTVGQNPQQVALTDDAVWVTNSGTGTVSRIDPATNTVVATIPAGAGAFGVAATSQAVWVSNGTAGTVTEIDPVTNAVIDTVALRSLPGGIVATADDVWVTGANDATVSHIDPERGQVTDTVSVGNLPNGIALANGALWVANTADHTVTRLNANTDAIVATIDLATGTRPIAVAATDDAIWVTGFGNATLTRIDPATNDVVATIDVGNEATGVAATDDVVWVANQADGTVSRVEPTTNQLVQNVDVGDAPTGVAATDTDVWVTNFQPGTVTRVDPGDG